MGRSVEQEWGRSLAECLNYNIPSVGTFGRPQTQDPGPFCLKKRRMWVNKQCWKCFTLCLCIRVSDKRSSYILAAALEYCPCPVAGACVCRWVHRQAQQGVHPAGLGVEWG